MILVITGARISPNSFNNHVGTGSRAHDLKRDLAIILFTSSTVRVPMVVKKAGGGCSLSGRTEVIAVALSESMLSKSRFSLILAIFLLKEIIARI